MGVVTTAVVVVAVRLKGRRRRERGRARNETEQQTTDRNYESISTYSMIRGGTVDCTSSTVHAARTSDIELKHNGAYDLMGRRSETDPYYSGYVIPDLLDAVAQSGLHAA